MIAYMELIPDQNQKFLKSLAQYIWTLKPEKIFNYKLEYLFLRRYLQLHFYVCCHKFEFWSQIKSFRLIRSSVLKLLVSFLKITRTDAPFGGLCEASGGRLASLAYTPPLAPRPAQNTKNENQEKIFSKKFLSWKKNSATKKKNLKKIEKEKKKKKKNSCKFFRKFFFRFFEFFFP